MVEPHIRRFANFPEWQGKNVLELGCGIGTDTLEFIRAGVGRMNAVDLSLESVKIARSRLPDGPISAFNRSICVGNAEDNLSIYPYAFDYDLVYSFGMLHHTPHPERVVEVAYDRLKAGGEFRFMVYAKWSIKNLTRQQPEAQPGCPIARTYTARKVRKLLGDYFDIISIEKAHIFPWKVSEYVTHTYIRSAWYRWMPSPLFALLERQLGWHLLVRARKKNLPVKRSGGKQRYPMLSFRGVV